MGEIEGTVVPGMKKAQEFLSIEEYQNRIEKVTGFRPFPGTLNLEVDSEKSRKLKKEADRERIESFKKDGEDFGGLTVYKASIKDVKVAVLEIDRSDYGDEILEVVAADKLREKFDLEDGDQLKVRW